MSDILDVPSQAEHLTERVYLNIKPEKKGRNHYICLVHFRNDGPGFSWVSKSTGSRMFRQKLASRSESAFTEDFPFIGRLHSGLCKPTDQRMHYLPPIFLMRH